MYIEKIAEDISISPLSNKIIKDILNENSFLKEIIDSSSNLNEFKEKLRNLAENKLKENNIAWEFYRDEKSDRKKFEQLRWVDFAAIRILDYIDNSGRTFTDLNLRGEKFYNDAFEIFWNGVKYGRGGGEPNYFKDMYFLFKQFRGELELNKPTKDDLMKWMERYPSGLDPRIRKIQEENKKRIMTIIIRKIESGEINNPRYNFKPNTSFEEKLQIVSKWWEDHVFHLRFAVRNPELLNEMLGNTLSPVTMKRLYKAKKKGIPFFVNPYYLSLICVNEPNFAIGADLAIRDYIFYSEELIKEYGHIVAWEKEDLVKEGEPNAAGWILPSQHSVHRRYPEVAIMIPDTAGRACGGLCASCQRMYDFQSGHLNFDLDVLKPKETWNQKLKRLLKYWEEDTQLRDILITGGDALMSVDKSLKKILDEVYEMAKRKIEANKSRPEGKKYAELVRVRLGTRLPVYLPQRVTPELTNILAEFKEKASKIGVKQFVIQTHFESPMEITPESKQCINRLVSAGWTVTNQHVMTAASSRRGHVAKLRKDLNDIGVLPYYTFSVKGYKENKHNFATNARAIQEQLEEKVFGLVPDEYKDEIKEFPLKAENMVENINKLREKAGLPFLAIDRNVLNLPGVGKSLTFRTIGITHDGRRVLEFDHDSTRNHSPIIHKMGKVIIIESKSIGEYIDQMAEYGENIEEYSSLWGYSLGSTEPRFPIYEYPEYDFEITDELSNLKID